MTPQQIDAMKLAHEALKKCHYYMIDAGLPNQSLLNEGFTAYKALEEALAENAMQEVQRLGQEIEQEPVMILPDGSAFGVMSFPLPDDHWLYAPNEYKDGEYEPIDLPKPILTHELRDAVVAAVRYAVRGATMRGQETDFDPDALVQNAVYALCGPYATPPKPKPEQEPVAYMSHSKESFVSADDVGNSVPNWTDYYPTPLYAMPKPCPTCEALARTVMLDQTSHDAQRTWVGLTDEEQTQVAWSCGAMSVDWLDFTRAIEAKLKEKNT